MFTLHNIYFITKINDTVVDSNQAKELIVLYKPNMKMTQMKVTIFYVFFIFWEIYSKFLGLRYNPMVICSIATRNTKQETFYAMIADMYCAYSFFL